MLKCFVTFRLRPGVTAGDYAEWFRTENLDAAAELTAISDYRVWRRSAVHEGEPAWEFLEEMVVTDLERCRREFDGLPAMRSMLGRWRELVAGQSVVFAEAIARGGAPPAAPRPALKCFVSFTLRPGIAFERYREWLTQRNLPAVEQQTATRDLRVWRRLTVHEGEPEWDVIEELDVLDAARAAREFDELPAMRPVIAEWHELTSERAVVFAEELPQR